jgi:hypothetical protein
MLPHERDAYLELARRGEQGIWNAAKTYGEPALTMLTGAVADIASGLAGMHASRYLGPMKGADVVEEVQQAYTYMPQSEEGMGGLQAAGEFMQPLGDIISGAEQTLGQRTLEATGSPALAAIAHSIPTAIMEGVVLKGLGAATRPLRTDDVYSPRIFAGVKAKTADLPSLEAAKKMRDRGATRDEIWKETGWFESPDGWKFEISDEGFMLTGKGLDDDAYTSVGGAVMHNRLFSAYPNVGEIDIALSRSGSGGSYTPYVDRGSDEFPQYEQINVDQAFNPARRSTTGHELQHAIQQREGFARGGSPLQFETIDAVANPAFEKALVKWNDYLKSKGYPEENLFQPEDITYNTPDLMSSKLLDQAQWLEDVTGQYEPKFDELFPSGLHEESLLDPYEQYLRLAGEAEARNVQTRLDWTPEQRRETPPWQSLDVPEEELTHRDPQGMQGLAMSVEELAGIEAWHGSPHDFERFDVGEIGTGEGAQAYGHGLYFAGKRDVAEWYRDKLNDAFSSERDNQTQQEWKDFLNTKIEDARVQREALLEEKAAIPVKQFSDDELLDYMLGKKQITPEEDAAAVRHAQIDKQVFDLERRMKEIGYIPMRSDPMIMSVQKRNNQLFGKEPPKEERAAMALFDEFEENTPSSGALYNVNLKMNPEQLIDYDQPIAKQNTEVLSRIKKAFPELGDDPELYFRDLLENFGNYSSPEISEKLKAAGVPGIKYAAGDSRGGKGTNQNYVVFDDKTIGIIKKYGIAGLATTGALMAQEEDKATLQ